MTVPVVSRNSSTRTCLGRFFRETIDIALNPSHRERRPKNLNTPLRQARTHPNIKGPAHRKVVHVGIGKLGIVIACHLDLRRNNRPLTFPRNKLILESSQISSFSNLVKDTCETRANS